MLVCKCIKQSQLRNEQEQKTSKEVISHGHVRGSRQQLWASTRKTKPQSWWVHIGLLFWLKKPQQNQNVIAEACCRLQSPITQKIHKCMNRNIHLIFVWDWEMYKFYIMISAHLFLSFRISRLSIKQAWCWRFHSFVCLYNIKMKIIRPLHINIDENNSLGNIWILWRIIFW